MRVTALQVINGPQDALAALEALSYRAQEDLQRAPRPLLYESGMRYARRSGENAWRVPSESMALGYDHCPGLAAWRVAELRLRRIDRNATVHIRHGGRQGLWHILVRRGDGSLEDPSAILGMPRRWRLS